MSATTLNIIDEILSQLANREEVLQGVEAAIIEHEFAYQRGEFIKKETREEFLKPVREEWLDDFVNSIEVLERAKNIFEAMPYQRKNEVHLRATPELAKKFKPPNISMASFIDTIVLAKEPARLIRMETKAVNLPWWLKWPRVLVVKSFDAVVEYQYFRGIPFPAKISIRVETRGIGPWRWGGGEDTEIRYKAKKE